jgi:Reverse transcriptase (RNA-dependent DNA polymerase)
MVFAATSNTEKFTDDIWMCDSDLHEEIFMKLPDGYAEVKRRQDDSMCFKLNKSIYRLIQAAREWNRRFNSEMINLGFKINNVDPCLFYMEDKGKICIVCLYIDDMIITGDVRLMVKTVEGLRKVFEVKVQYTIKDFLSCEIIKLPGEIHIYQSRIIQKMLKDVESSKEGKYKTPSAPGFRVIRPTEEEKVDAETQKWFRSTIGSLLYLVKLSRPDLCNAV